MKNRPRVGYSRRIARDLLENICCDDAPIILREVFRHLKVSKNIHVEAYDLGKNLSGTFLAEGERYCIYYHIHHHKNRQRFSVAHELGHILLDHTPHSLEIDFSSLLPEEQEANQFAAELLMPLKLLKKEKIDSIPRLAKRYEVSEQAMGWRVVDQSLRLM